MDIQLVRVKGLNNLLFFLISILTCGELSHQSLSKKLIEKKI